MTTDNFCLYL